MSASIIQDGAPGPQPRWRASWLTIQLGAAAVLVALADALFYGHRVGISLALFLAVLAAASACLNKVRAEPSRRWRAVTLLAAGLLPIVEDISWLSVTIALLATAASAGTLTEARDLHWWEQLRAALRLPFSGIFRLLGDLSRIILSHLIDNALHHGATRIELLAVAASDRLDLVVQDNGSGISPNNRTRIFDSFFTTRRDSGGTGMGLSIARAMLTAHGGAITLLDNPDGAAFRLSVPLAGRSGDG